MALELQLKDQATGRVVVLFPPPSLIPFAQSGTERSFELMGVGGARFPDGQSPAVWDFEGFFPGAAEYGKAWARADRWRPPKDIAFDLQEWRRLKTPLQFVVGQEFTQPPLLGVIGVDAATNINHTVFVSRFDQTWGEAYGRLRYQLTLVELVPLVIPLDGTVAPVTSEPAAAESTIDAGAVEPNPPVWDLSPGDTLIDIAALVYGDSGRYVDIWAANQAPSGILGADPDVIPDAGRLVIPP